MSSITLFFKTPKEYYTWAAKNIPEFANSGGASSANNGLSTTRSYNQANLDTPDGMVMAAQCVVQAINTVKDIEQLATYYNGNKELSFKIGKSSAILGGVQVVLSGFAKAVDGDPFTHPLNDAEIGDFLTGAASILAFVPGGQPLAAIITVGSLIYNIYSYATGKSITFEELVEGSHQDALNTFIDNNSNSLFDKTNYDNLIVGVGGDSVARWIFNAYLGHGKGQIVEPSKYQDYLSLLYNGYKDEAGIPKIVPPRELHFILLNTNIQHTLDTFKFERDSGNENMAKSIIYALEGLNPLALENSSQNISILYNFIEPQNYSDEWILARSWMLLESLSIASTNRQDGAFAQFYNHFDIVRAKEHLQYSIKNARSLFNVEDDAKIIFDSGSYSFETSNSGTEYRIVFKTNNQVVEGSNSSDWLFGSLDNDVFHADAGNDKIFAEDGDDEITGGSGRNLLNGGKGRDFYHFNTADGDFDDTIIDSDGKGQLIIDGESLLGHFFDPKAGVINAWTAKIGNYDWQAVLTDNGDLILNTLQGNHRITIPGW